MSRIERVVRGNVRWTEEELKGLEQYCDKAVANQETITNLARRVKEIEPYKERSITSLENKLQKTVVRLRMEKAG